MIIAEIKLRKPVDQELKLIMKSDYIITKDAVPAKDEFNSYLFKKLKELKNAFESNDKNHLIRKRDEIKSQVKMLRDDIHRMKRLLTISRKDEKTMKEWINKLEEENARLSERVRNLREIK